MRDAISTREKSRRAVDHRMTRRCADWDYCQRAIYMITLVQRDRQHARLARIEIADGRDGWRPLADARALNLPPEKVEARARLTPLGEAILAHWKRIGEFTPEIRPLYCQIMPDHLHALLEVTRPMAWPLGNAIAGFKTGCEKIYRELALSAQDKPAINGGLSATAIGPAVNGGLSATAIGPAVNGGPTGQRLWADGFQDSILFHAGQLDNMFHYLADNPRRLAIKQLFPDLFRVVGELRFGLNFAPSEGGACPVPGAQAPGCQVIGSFAALGNRFLLSQPLAQVQVSRRDFGYRRESKSGGRGLRIARDAAGAPLAAFTTPAFEAKRDSLLLAAKRGATLISPCVSDGEREIARLALAAGLRLVALANKGFSPLQKPVGRLFEACADGRLLLLAPSAWPYVPGEKPMTREDALVLNRLAQALAGDGAAKVNYHGATLADVDGHARRAVKG